VSGLSLLDGVTPVAEPQIFETFNDPHRGHVFRAQVGAVCQP